MTKRKGTLITINDFSLSNLCPRKGEVIKGPREKELLTTKNQSPHEKEDLDLDLPIPRLVSQLEGRISRLISEV